MKSVASIDAALYFLGSNTPSAWYRNALENIDLLLIDHANCEKKAAGTAISLMYRYVDKEALLPVLSRLAREELRHFELVHRQLIELNITYNHLTPSRYAGALKSMISTVEPQRLVDCLLVAAVVEARSCERFLGLSDVLKGKLGPFYSDLAISEARHFRTYIDMAKRYTCVSLDQRIQEFLAAEFKLISDPDENFRFHSGPLRESIP